MIIALASPRVASTLDEGLDKIKWLLSEASAQGAEIVCFPEALEACASRLGATFFRSDKVLPFSFQSLQQRTGD